MDSDNKKHTRVLNKKKNNFGLQQIPHFYRQLSLQDATKERFKILAFLTKKTALLCFYNPE